MSGSAVEDEPLVLAVPLAGEVEVSRAAGLGRHAAAHSAEVAPFGSDVADEQEAQLLAPGHQARHLPAGRLGQNAGLQVDLQLLLVEGALDDPLDGRHGRSVGLQGLELQQQNQVRLLQQDVRRQVRVDDPQGCAGKNQCDPQDDGHCTTAFHGISLSGGCPDRFPR